MSLYVVLKLSSTSFINSLSRFQARFSGVRRQYADNATNNRGADRELKEFFQEHEDDMQKSLLEMKIEFKFIPLNAPHHSGTWESMVKLIN